MQQLVDQSQVAGYPFSPAPLHLAQRSVVGARPWLEWRVLVRLLSATVIPGLPFVLARALLHDRSGVLNMDFFLVTVLACAGYRRMAAVLFLATDALECVRIFDSIFYFSQRDLKYGAHFLGDVPLWLSGLWALAFALFALAGLIAWRSLLPQVSWMRVRRPAMVVGGVLALLLLVDLAQGFNPIQRLRDGRPRPHLVGELLFRMPASLLGTSYQPATVKVLDRSATSPLWLNAAAVSAAHENVVVVVVESMGLLQDRDGVSQEFSAFADPRIQQLYHVNQGSVPFDGPTVVGEMRELCHLDTDIHIDEQTVAGHAPCLPQQFRERGYDTAAFHGFRGTMFHRRTWYPKVGFQETDFLRELKDVPICNGAFFGPCDAAVAAKLEQRLADRTAARGRPQFLYWMTLNGHLPVDVARAPQQPCPIHADTEVCAQLAYTEEVLSAVKKLALDPRIGRTEIVVVGDHAPPYVSLARRELFSSSSVPFVTLTPKG